MFRPLPGEVKGAYISGSPQRILRAWAANPTRRAEMKKAREMGINHFPGPSSSDVASSLRQAVQREQPVAH